MIDQINFFTLDKKSIYSINNNQKENNDQKNTKLIFDLISTKSNYCQEKFLTQIKSLLDYISLLIQKSTFEDVFIQDKKPIDFSNINDRYLDIIHDFTKHFSDQTNKQEDKMKEMKNVPQINQILNVLNLKSNYLKQDYLVEFEKYIIEAYPLLSQIKFDTIFKDNHKISILQEMSDETLHNIVQLTQKINELQRNGNDGKQNQRIKQKLSGVLNEEYQKEELDKLLQNYPIFDLLKPSNLIDILSQMQMIKTNFGQINKLQILKNNHNQISISQNLNDRYTNCVSDFILDEKANYAFRFQIISFNQTEEEVMIGLVRDSEKDKTEGYEDYMSCRFLINQNFFYEGDCGIEKEDKGAFDLLKKDQVIEMRVNIQNEVLQMLDYPNYNHILSIAD